MLFSSNIFVFAFLPAVLIGYYLVCRTIRWKNYFLLIASLLFYAWGEPLYVLLMIASVAGNYGFGRAIDRCAPGRSRKLWLVLTVVFNLGILFYFKYLNFTVTNINALFGTQLSVQKVVMPIGISFFTFQAMSYVIDVYRGRTEVQKNPLYLALYISFFPQLIAGPIVRYSTIEEQILHRTVDMDKFQTGVLRFVQGFAKKVILSNVLAVVSEEAFGLAARQDLTVMLAWLGSLAYTFQIFFDFSGYSDMAIGLGRMFGFEFEENFRYPYLSRSVSEFWNRWHISLGHWFRDYVYFPLGGSRVSRGKMIRNLFVVWLLTGIWHGAAWQFILWGVGYGVIISLEKLTGFPRCLKNRWAILGYGVFTFFVVNIGWVFFGARDLQAALYQLGVMFGFRQAPVYNALAQSLWNEKWPYFLLAAIFSTPAMGAALKRVKQGTAYHIVRSLVYALLLLLAASYLAMGVYNPFIYFNF